MDPLFPPLPEDLKAISDGDLAELLKEHASAKELIDAEDEKFLADENGEPLDADVILAELEKGANQNDLLLAEQTARAEAHAAYIEKKAEITARFEPKAEDPEPVPDDPSESAPDDDDRAETEEAPVEVVAEEELVEEKAEEKELVLASADIDTEANTGTTSTNVVRFARRPPAPSPERVPKEEEKGVALMASGELSLQFKEPLSPPSLADLVVTAMEHHGSMPKVDPPGKYRFGGPEHKLARAEWDYPEDRQLTSDADGNAEKIKAVVAASIPGGYGEYSLTASGGLCAPLEPIYSMPNFATDAEPVWDALPKFQARRGGVNVPEATVIGDITTAISSISEANDALGGTFATKSCQDLTCPAYTEVAVQILAHCREYGNLNARAWPEKIAHENALTMAALARTSEMFMLERIKALSVNVTSGAETLGALVYLVDAIVKSMYGIRSRLRMPSGARFRALLPVVVLDILVLDAIQNQFDRYKTRGDVDAYLRSVGIDPVYYIDGDFAAGADQVADAAQAAGALEAFPDTIQWALYPEGAFLGIDMGVLELGIVRDSTLNSTNDFQVFGEKFRNVARIAPAQATYWETTDICANGQFPPAGTARTCD
jgi:hypothetical protein